MAKKVNYPSKSVNLYKQKFSGKINTFCTTFENDIIDFVEDSKNLKDFEKRVEIVDGYINSLRDELDRIEREYYDMFVNEFTPKSVMAATDFQFKYLPLKYFQNPSVFADDILPLTICKSLIKDYKKNNKANANIDEIEPNMTSVLHKASGFNILEINFNFGEDKSNLLYDKIYFPYRVNNMMELETASPFFINYNRNNKRNQIFFFDLEETDEGFRMYPVFYEDCKKGNELKIIEKAIEPVDDFDNIIPMGYA